MNFTQDDIAAIIGTKELEIIALRRELLGLKAKLKEIEDGLHKNPDSGRGKLATLEGGKGQDDGASNA